VKSIGFNSNEYIEDTVPARVGSAIATMWTCPTSWRFAAIIFGFATFLQPLFYHGALAKDQEEEEDRGITNGGWVGGLFVNLAIHQLQCHGQ